MRQLETATNYFIVMLLVLSLSFSNVRLPEISDRVNILASDYAFDFVGWTFDAVWIKLTQSAIASPRYFTAESQHLVVTEYLKIVDEIDKIRNDIDQIYADPSINDPASASQSLRQQYDRLTLRQKSLAPLAESVLEMQVTSILKELGLTSGGQPIPWVLYHTSALPQNLIVSPRGKIEQEASYPLEPNFTVDQASSLETKVDKNLNVSSLVVKVGGLATYPTMIMRTTAMNWLPDTIAHEWVHIYLGQRPLGLNYGTTPEVRTMNETTASIAGGEIGRLVLERYYPELVHRYPADAQLTSLSPAPPADFDIRAEMHITRVHVDELLAQGKIDEAETYMETRRKFFWENGYPIRKLNQAYFAFHGAYADVPGGAAGEDPVGPAVRELRAQSQSLKEFLEKIGKMSTFEELKKAIGQ